MRATLRRALRVLLLVTMLCAAGSLVEGSTAAASARVPAAGSGTPPVPTSTITPDPSPGTVTYCVNNYAPNSDVSVANNANGQVGTIHTDGSGHGCTTMPVKTDCSQSTSNTIVASGQDQANKPATSQATYNAPANPSQCAGGTPTPTPTSTCDPTQATLSVYIVAQGATLRGTACGFSPGESVSGFIHSTTPRFLGTTAAEVDGSATVRGRIPVCISPGTHEFTLVGSTSGHVASATFEVERSAACTPVVAAGGGSVPGAGSGVSGTRANQGGGPIGGLAFTGAWIATMVAIALALLAVGSLVVVSVRRRRTAPGTVASA